MQFVLSNIEAGEFRYFYAHENNTLFDKSMLLCTEADLTTIQNKVNKQDIIEICKQETRETKYKMAIQVDHHFGHLFGKRTHWMSRFIDSPTTSEE